MDAVEKLRIHPDARTHTHAMWRSCESRVWDTRMAWNTAPNTLVLVVFLLLALPALALLPVVVRLRRFLLASSTQALEQGVHARVQGGGAG
jgi:hypothetical protein